MSCVQTKMSVTHCHRRPSKCASWIQKRTGMTGCCELHTATRSKRMFRRVQTELCGNPLSLEFIAWFVERPDAAARTNTATGIHRVAFRVSRQNCMDTHCHQNPSSCSSSSSCLAAASASGCPSFTLRWRVIECSRSVRIFFRRRRNPSHCRRPDLRVHDKQLNVSNMICFVGRTPTQEALGQALASTQNKRDCGRTQCHVTVLC